MAAAEDDPEKTTGVPSRINWVNTIPASTSAF